MSCHSSSKGRSVEQRSSIIIALAGNANVGKSAIFNVLTGLHQHVGNWPGKTVERAEGSLVFKGYNIDVIDLPGIYSFSTFSIEELVSREYIAFEKPDIVVNVIDASALERNLYFTLQLLELKVPLIVALNLMDIAKEKGIEINVERLSELLGVPVVPTVATKGIGIDKLLEKVIDVYEGNLAVGPKTISYGKEIEERINKLEEIIKNFKVPYPPRFVAIKLLEGDEDIKRLMNEVDARIVEEAEVFAKEIEEIHGEPRHIVIASERYTVAHKVASEVQKLATKALRSTVEKVDDLITHRVAGYPIMVAVVGLAFYAIFSFGSFLSELLGSAFEIFTPPLSGLSSQILWEGAYGGFVAGVTLVLPYVLPFYILLTLLEDFGYLPRVAFLLDNVMHKMGLHGKAIIPLIMGYGCNVPACYSCRIMETTRDRLIAAFAVTFIPCTARVIVIFGLVAAFVGIEWAFALLLIDLAIVFLMGRLAFKALPGESMGLIMELHPLRVPSLRVVLPQVWARIKSIIYIVFPIYIVGGIVIALAQIFGLLKPVEALLSPITVGWLGLPAFTSTLLIFGLVRKELVVVLPALLFGTTDLGSIFTPVQMLVLAFVAMICVPCFATFAMLKREFGWKTSTYILIFEVALALVLGGLFFRFVQLLNIL